MYDLLKLQAQAWAENKPNGKIWTFEWSGRNGSVKIMIHQKGITGNKDGTFFTDKNGIAAAAKFITENLNKK